MNMSKDLNILITNDDGYTSKGIRELVEIMRQFGRITVVAPKNHQSGMSVALTLGGTSIAYKKLEEKDGVSWSYVDGTPASCVKFALDQICPNRKCEGVVCGINHGSNASVATNYSGTMGAAEEAAINGIPSIGVSLCNYDEDADFSKVSEHFPGIFTSLMENRPARKGISYNVNFPSSGIPVKGIRVCHQGSGVWIKEYEPWDGSLGDIRSEEGEQVYVMRGEFIDTADQDDAEADHHALRDGYISIVPQRFDRTDTDEGKRLSSFLNMDF